MSTIQNTYTRDEILMVVAQSRVDTRGGRTSEIYQLAYLLANFGIEVAKR